MLRLTFLATVSLVAWGRFFSCLWWLFHLCCGLFAERSSSCSLLSTAQCLFPSVLGLIPGFRWGEHCDQPMEMQREEWTLPLCSLHWSELERVDMGCGEGASCPVLTLQRHSLVPLKHPQHWRALLKGLSLEGRACPSHVIIPHLRSLFVSYRW